LNVSLNLVLIPWIGYRGAALSTVVVEGFLLVVLLTYLRRTALRPETWNLFGKPALAVASACVPTFVLLSSSHWAVKLVLFNTTFATMLFVLKIVGQTEIEAVSAVVRPARARTAELS